MLMTALHIFGLLHLTRGLIGNGVGGEYSYICVLPEEFLLKSVVFNLSSFQKKLVKQNTNI